MRRRPKNVVILGCLCGIFGPLVGVGVVYVFAGSASGDAVSGASAGRTFLVYCIYAVTVFGPIAGCLGGLAAWLLMKLRDTGVGGSKLILVGGIVGVVLGVLTVPITLGLLLLPLSLLRGAWSEIHSLGTLMDLTHPYFRAAVFVGLIVGCGVAAIIEGFPVQRNSPHGVRPRRS